MYLFICSKAKRSEVGTTVTFGPWVPTILCTLLAFTDLVVERKRRMLQSDEGEPNRKVWEIANVPATLRWESIWVKKWERIKCNRQTKEQYADAGGLLLMRADNSNIVLFKLPILLNINAKCTFPQVFALLLQTIVRTIYVSYIMYLGLVTEVWRRHDIITSLVFVFDGDNMHEGHQRPSRGINPAPPPCQARLFLSPAVLIRSLLFHLFLHSRSTPACPGPFVLF